MKWEELRGRLGAATEEQVEAIRRVGAPARHAARVAEARSDLETRLAAVVQAAPNDQASEIHDIDRSAVAAHVFAAIRAAVDAIGKPGSSAGTSPPGWYSNHPAVGCRIGALLEAMDCMVEQRWPFVKEMRDLGVGVWTGDDYRPAHVVVADGPIVEIMRDDEDCTIVARVDSDQMPVLAEHLLANAIRKPAEAVEEWLRLQIGERPKLPDAGACKLHAALVQRRRMRAVDGQ